MSIEIVEVLNLETGARGRIRRDWFENPVINANILVEVDEDQKPYVDGLYKSRLKDHEDTEEVQDEVEDESETEDDDQEETD